MNHSVQNQIFSIYIPYVLPSLSEILIIDIFDQLFNQDYWSDNYAIQTHVKILNILWKPRYNKKNVIYSYSCIIYFNLSDYEIKKNRSSIINKFIDNLNNGLEEKIIYDMKYNRYFRINKNFIRYNKFFKKNIIARIVHNSNTITNINNVSSLTKFWTPFNTRIIY